MKIRNKILLYFSSTVILLSAVSLIILYILFAEYREAEFQQRQKEKLNITIGLLIEYKEMSENLTSIMDQLTINDFYDEKVLVYDVHKDLVYASVDNLMIKRANEILHSLSPAKQRIETTEDGYDIIGIYTEHDQRSYYAISKAYDTFGYSKLFFLRNTLVFIFLVISVVVIILSFYLSSVISKPISHLANNLQNYKPEMYEPHREINLPTNSYELQYLSEKFNELLKRTHEAFTFQKNAIQHISHELKTPVAVLLSELERIRTFTSLDKTQKALDVQINKTKSLGEIVHVLLVISKIESGQHVPKIEVRIDEVLFDIIEELNNVYPDFNFNMRYYPDLFDDKKLVVCVNSMMIRQAFLNLLNNCITYSATQSAEILFDCTREGELHVEISNSGTTVSGEEQNYLFDHFFRGKNSHGTFGSGLGLVLTKKIILLNFGKIAYSVREQNINTFSVTLPLS